MDVSISSNGSALNFPNVMRGVALVVVVDCGRVGEIWTEAKGDHYTLHLGGEGGKSGVGDILSVFNPLTHLHTYILP